MKCITVFCIMMFLFLLPFHGYAQKCTVMTEPVNFGAYDVFSPFPLTTSAKVQVTCKNKPKKTMPVSVSINRGSSGGFAPRQMLQLNGSDRMNYNLFIDSSRTTVWGDGTGGTAIFTQNVNLESPLNTSIFASVPARQNLRAGTYSDSLVVTVNW